MILGLLVVLLSIPERSIDELVTRAISLYADSLYSKSKSAKSSYHFIGMIEEKGQERLLYIGAVVATSYFWNNVPDSFSKHGTQIVFWYESVREESSQNQYFDFCHQFAGKLMVDMNDQGELDPAMDFEVSRLPMIGTFRIVIDSSSIVGLKKVCTFPNRAFHARGLRFDGNGNLMFRDGAYEYCALDKPFNVSQNGFDPFEFIQKKSNLPLQYLRERNVIAEITVNPNGKVLSVDIRSKKPIEDSIKRMVVSFIMEMPNLSQATVEGKPVSYRIGLVL